MTRCSLQQVASTNPDGQGERNAGEDRGSR
jgi:hypothetical protein